MKVQNYLLNSSKKVHRNSLSKALFRTILIVAVLMLALDSVSASLLKQAVIVDYLKETSMTESINLSLSNNTDANFSLTLPDKAYNIVVNGKKFSNNTLKIPLSCAQCEIGISYSLDNIVKKVNNQFSFYRTLHFPKVPEQQTYLIHLPVGHSINITDEASPSIVPKPTEIFTDGENIIIGWKEKNPESPSQYLVVYYNTESFESLSYIIKNDLSHTSVVIINILLLIIGLVAGFFVNKAIAKRLQKKAPKEPAKQFIVPASLLSPDEKIVVDFLKKKDAKKNPVNQKEIGKELNWSKSKVSAVLSNLYYKKIIDREKFGRNYKVKLVKDVA